MSEAFMPSVPIAMPSVTEIVLNSIGVPPLARMPSATFWASLRWLELHGVSSIQQCATPTSGRERSSSVNPTARKYERAAARSAPSSSARLLWRGSNVMAALRWGASVPSCGALGDEEGELAVLDDLAALVDDLALFDDHAAFLHRALERGL